MSARRVVVIHNPIAGRRRRRRLAETLRLLGERCAVTLVTTTAPGEAETIAARIAPGSCDAIVVAGGDGTINEVVNGLRADAPPMAVIPLGTANVFAREIGLLLPPARLARAIAEGAPSAIHVAAANGRRFVQMAGIGFDARVVAGVDPGLKRRLGRAAYGVEMVRQWRRLTPARYTVAVGGETLEASAVIIANGRHYGGPFVIAPDASPWRGALAVCAFTASGRAALVRYLLALGAGTLARRADMRMLWASSLEIAGSEGEAVQLDGDIRACLPCRIAMTEQPLRVIAGGDALTRAASDRR